MKPQFGIKDYKVIQASWGEDDAPTEMLEVKFLNERTYHSKWDNLNGEMMPCSRLYTHRHGDSVPLEEQDMEFLVVECLCHTFFNPCMADKKKKGNLV